MGLCSVYCRYLGLFLILLTFSIGCGFSSETPVRISSELLPESDLLTVEDNTSEEVIAPPESSARAAKLNIPKTTMVAVASARNPFQPPAVQVRTLTERQVESADIRMLGIAKRENQRIALLENGGSIHQAVVGDFVGQWEILNITENTATMRRGLEQISLQIN